LDKEAFKGIPFCLASSCRQTIQKPIKFSCLLNNFQIVLFCITSSKIWNVFIKVTLYITVTRHPLVSCFLPQNSFSKTGRDKIPSWFVLPLGDVKQVTNSVIHVATICFLTRCEFSVDNGISPTYKLFTTSDTNNNAECFISCALFAGQQNNHKSSTSGIEFLATWLPLKPQLFIWKIAGYVFLNFHCLPLRHSKYVYKI